MTTTDSPTVLPDAALTSSVPTTTVLPDATATTSSDLGTASAGTVPPGAVPSPPVLPGAVPSPPVLPGAVLWDMDGTLVDTEPLWAESLAATVLAHGGTWDDSHARATLGASTAVTLDLVRSVLPGVSLPSRFFDEVEARVLAGLEDQVPLQPGARELLDSFRAHRIPQALVTASNRRVAARVLRALGPRHFQAVVTDDMPIPSKPDPAPYVLAARLLEVRTRDCLVFEDSVPGLAAARASGARVWDVTTAPLTSYVLPAVPART